MVRAEGDRALEGIGPARQRLAGDVVQQIDVDRPDPGGPGGIDRIGDVARRVAAAELTQLGGVEALRPERDPADARVALEEDVAAFIRAGIGLDRDLGPVGQPEPPADAFDDPGQVVRSEQ